MIFQGSMGFFLSDFLYPNKEAPEVEVNNAAKICGHVCSKKCINSGQFRDSLL